MSYCVIMKSETQHKTLLEKFTRNAAIAVVSRDGGLVSHLTAVDNIKLPVHYHAIEEARLMPYTSTLFHRYGLIGETELQQMLLKLPEQMVTYEKRLTGFIRALFVEPSLIVYDEIYEGLALREVEQIAKFDEFFHLCFPFRTSVLLSFDNFNHPPGTHPNLIYLDEASR